MDAKEFLKAENNWGEKDTGLFDRDSLADLLDRYAQQSNRAETVVGQVSVSPANGETAGKFEEAYNHAMTVLTQYILTSEEKRAKAEADGNKETQEHYRWKVHFMRTAKTTIKENIKMYLEHPELFVEG